MDNIKRCIFHVPNNIDKSAKSGSSKRPLKMIEAFESNGYVVDVVMGYAKERKKQISRIKKNIKNGIKYDFLYSESSTMPTALTEKNHLPTHPFMDFAFLNFCRKKGIRVGLFYRDIYWKFDFYKKSIPAWQSIVTILFYKYDLYKYRKILDILYLPSKEMKYVLPYKNRNESKYKIYSLPPGCEKNVNNEKKKNDNTLNIFYVGGISEDVYNFEKLFDAVSKTKGITLKICCRESEWLKQQDGLNKYLNENISIVHLTGEKLNECYKEADICSLIFGESEYRKFAMPIKLFEYLSNNKPIIATKDTAAGKFVEENGIGWTVRYDTKEIISLLERLKKDNSEIEKIKLNQKKIIEENTWEIRAREVANDLSLLSDLK